jgi:hypothetical protein
MLTQKHNSMKESFLIYKSTYSAIKGLSLEEKGLLLDAIFQYNIEGILIDLPPVLKMAFSFMKDQFDRDNKKYEAICRRNRSNIQKRWDTKNTSGKSGIPKIPVATKNTDTDTDTGTDTDNKDKRHAPIPSFEDFKDYAIKNQPGTDLHKLDLKYKSWKENGWKDGKDKPIRNWKTKLLNTLPFLKMEPGNINAQTKKERYEKPLER